MADYLNEYGLCPSWALSLGYMGVAAGACLSNWGSAVSGYFSTTAKGFVVRCPPSLFYYIWYEYGYILRCHVSVGMGETNGTPGGDAPILGRGSL